ncbi:MAG TPA: hypothetical protein VFZ25_02415, partial [Chloroflexota bacterium]|nr:hypothetical protein [Chloroflexota bacterium]
LPARGRDRKGALYVLVDIEGTAEGTAGGTLVEQIRQSLVTTFYHDAGSVTSSLLRAIRRVNESLYEENERSIRSERRYATIIAAVARDTDLYFAIVGPARAYLVDGGPTERVGADDEEPPRRVGESDEVGIAMYHRGRERASILILTSGDLPATLDKTLREVPEIPAERALPLLRLLGEHGGLAFRALAIVPTELSDNGQAPVTFPPDPDEEGFTSEPKRAPALPRARFDRSGDEDDKEDGSDDRGAAGSRRFRPRVRVPFGVAIGLGIFALFVVGYLVAQIPLGMFRNGAAYANIVTRIAQAEQEEKTGLSQSDPLAKRQHLDNARRLALEAQSLAPDNRSAATAVARIQSEYQAATGTIALPAPVHLLDLPSPADEMVVQGGEIYLLHRQASQVDRYLMNADQTAVLRSASPTLIRKGDHIGGSTVGDLMTMAWIPAGGARDADSLVVLDRSGFLIEYDSTRGLRGLALRDPASWDHVSQLGGYAGNLFALNPSTRTLTWYPPEPSGYDGDAYNYFAPATSVNLGDATAFLAGNDLYLVHLSGQLQKFTAGTLDSFAGPPADLAPAHPAGLASAAGSVYIGDPQRALILQIGTDGTYQRALGGDQSESVLANLRDLAVSDDGKSLFVLTDKAIERFDLTQAH